MLKHLTMINVGPAPTMELEFGKRMNLLTGDKALDSKLKNAAKNTITRLKLDSVEHNQMRAKHYVWYLRKNDEETLKELSPFIWNEAQRQGML